MFQYFSNRMSPVARFAMILVKKLFVSTCKPAVPSGDACASGHCSCTRYTTKYYVLRTTAGMYRPTNIHAHAVVLQ